MSCVFPAQALLALRRSISGQTHGAQYQPNIKWSTAHELIADIDRMRWAHEEQTGCQCWLEAISRAAQGLATATTTPASAAAPSASTASTATCAPAKERA